MNIAVGADHRGADIVDHVVDTLRGQSCEIALLHRPETRMCDYPDMAYPIAAAVSSGQADLGILVCGSGIGMSIAANKVRGVRAALVHDEVGAEVARRHNDANVICLAADLLGIRVVERILQVCLRTEFEGGRHARRIEKIAAIEDGRDPTDVTDEAALLD